MREKDVFCVKKRFCWVLVILVLTAAVMSSATAEMSVITISSIYQDEGKLGVLANLTDMNGNDVVDNLSAESHYLVAENGEQKIATQSFLVENSRFQKVSYIFLVDGTMKYQDAVAANVATYDAANDRTIYYSTSTTPGSGSTPSTRTTASQISEGDATDMYQGPAGVNQKNNPLITTNSNVSENGSPLASSLAITAAAAAAAGAGFFILAKRRDDDDEEEQQQH